MTDVVADLLSFLDRSPTPYHAVAECVRRLESAGFRPLDPADAWELVRRRSALFRARRGKPRRVRGGPARGGRERVPLDRRAHRLAEPQVEAASRAGQCPATDSWRSRSTEASCFRPGWTAISGSAVASRSAPPMASRCECASTRPFLPDPEPGHPPEPRGQQGGPGPQPANTPGPGARSRAWCQNGVNLLADASAGAGVSGVPPRAEDIVGFDLVPCSISQPGTVGGDRGDEFLFFLGSAEQFRRRVMPGV